MSTTRTEPERKQSDAEEPRLRPAPAADPSARERIERTLDAAEAALEEARLHGDLDVAQEPSAHERSATRLTVSVLMPVFNERATIQEIVRRVRQEGLHDELLIVDDCSTDGTRDLLIELEQECEEVRVILHGYNKGKGAALKTAIAEARGDVILVQDADLEYSPADYARLLEPLERGEADVVYGSRFLENAAEQDPSWLHRFGNRMLTMASNLTTGLRLTDMETCYKAIRREALRGMTLREKRFGFEPEITAKLARRGARFVEMPISYDGRGHSEGKKIGLRDAFRALWCIARYGMFE